MQYKWEILSFLLLILAFFSLRLLFLTNLPMFTDEAIYIRWAQIALSDSSWRFISLVDGKQPLFVWAVAAFLNFFKDPLVAGRVVSILAGFASVLGLWMVSFALFRDKKIAFLTSLIYVVYPLAQVHDRMAIYDSMVASFTIWALYFSILLIRKARLDLVYTLGIVTGFGMLTKTSALFTLLSLPFTFLLFDFKKPHLFKRIARSLLSFLLVFVIAYAIYSLLRLSPLFYVIGQKNIVFIYTFSEWAKNPFGVLFHNLATFKIWLLDYLTLPVVILIFASFFSPSFWREKLLLLLYFIFPLVSLAFFGRLVYPRFLFFMTMAVLPLAGFGLVFLVSLLKNKISPRFVLPVLSFVFLIYPFYVSLIYAINPVRAPITLTDHIQYTSSWSAGWGLKESVDFFQKQAAKQKIFVATEGTFGLLPYGLEIYLIHNPNITIKGYWNSLRDKMPSAVVSASRKMPTYFIFYQPQHLSLQKKYPLRLVFAIREGDSNDFYRVYRVLK